MTFATGVVTWGPAGDLMEALLSCRRWRRAGYTPVIQAIVSPEDLRWFEEDKKRQEPHAV